MPKIIAGTGHRPDKLASIDPYGDRVREELASLAMLAILREAPTKVISGMALGWDEALADAALYLGLPLVAAVAFEGVEKRWAPSAQKRFHSYLERAHAVHVVTQAPLRGPFDAVKALRARNLWMLDQLKGPLDKLVALWNGDTSGGTAWTVQEGRKRGVRMVNMWTEWYDA